jgi:hypothetical protein
MPPGQRLGTGSLASLDYSPINMRCVNIYISNEEPFRQLESDLHRKFFIHKKLCQLSLLLQYCLVN